MSVTRSLGLRLRLLRLAERVMVTASIRVIRVRVIRVRVRRELGLICGLLGL